MTYTLVLFFSATSILHFYWALGGRKGFFMVLPQEESGDFVIIPRVRDCMSIGVLLLVCAVLYSGKLGLELPVPRGLVTTSYYLIPLVMIIRAIGDFRYIGFTKRIKNTSFSRYDTWCFSPLCLVVAILGFILAATENF